MDRLLKKLEQSYSKADALLEEWTSCHERLCRLATSASSVLGRLSILSEDNNYGVLKVIDGMPKMLVAQQVEALEMILQSMQTLLGDMERLSMGLEKLWRDGQRLVDADRGKASPSPGKKGRQSSSLPPSLRTAIDGLHALAIMHRDEHLLKTALINSISYGVRFFAEHLLSTLHSREGDLDAVLAVLSEQPNISPSQVKIVFMQMAAITGK